MSFRKVVVPEPGFKAFTQAQSDISKMEKVDTDMRQLLHSDIPDDVKIHMYNKFIHLFGKLLADFRNPGLNEAPPPPKKEEAEPAEPANDKKPKGKKVKIVEKVIVMTPRNRKKSNQEPKLSDALELHSRKNIALPKTPLIKTRIGRLVRKPNFYGFGKPFRVKKYKF